MVTINRVQHDEYIIDMHQSQYTFNGVAYTSIRVNMARVDEYSKCTSIVVYDDFEQNDNAEEIARMFCKAWEGFMEACKFCQVSPVSDGTCNGLGSYIKPRRVA